MSAARPLRLEAEVVENVATGGSNLRLRLAVGKPWPGSGPGQFVMLSPGAVPAAERFDPLLPRPMAIYRSHGSGPDTALDVLYKVSGRGTALLAEARAGQRVRLVGPLGRGFAPPADGETALLVGGGTGIASLYDLAAQACRRGPVRVLLGARCADELMGREDFAALDVALETATDDGSAGHHGLVTELLEARLADCRGEGKVARVYACGPTPMMRRAAELAEQAAAPCRVSLENRMACGYGVCLGCAVPRADAGFHLVCRDGPVFEAGELAWGGLP